MSGHFNSGEQHDELRWTQTVYYDYEMKHFAANDTVYLCCNIGSVSSVSKRVNIRIASINT